MKHFYILAFLFLTFDAFSQCPGLTIETQQEIDEFQQNYPDCDSILGDLIIDSYNIHNLNGLDQITSVTGTLKIQNTYIQNFIGLDNLVTVGATLEIKYNDQITTMEGLSDLQTIGGSFRVLANYDLINVYGLNSLTTVGSSLDFQSNRVLYSLTGLESLNFVGKFVRISRNSALHDLNGLNNLTVFNGPLEISINSSLVDISALSNINPSQITGLSIHGNYQLEVCNIAPICSFLSNPTGKIVIYNNAAGCYNSYAIANSCGIPPICLPYGDYYFFNQSDVDNFHTYYPDCLNLEGLVYISGETISNLIGLLGIKRVQSSLWIDETELLRDLKGLDSLTYVGGDLEVGFYDMWDNDTLASLTGLENLDTVNRALMIGSNLKLVNLDPLSSLKFVGDSIAIYLNPLLTNIDGLAGINTDSLSAVNIQYNPLLSKCAIESVCNYLNLPESATNIHNNAIGCQTRVEIEDECIVSTELIDDKNLWTIYPNPVTDNLVIDLESLQATIIIYDLLGKTLFEGELSFGQNIISVDHLEQGIYIVNISTGKHNYRRKVIKVD